MNPIRLFIGLAGIVFLAHSASAQTPFFFPGASAFTPQISVVNTGIVNDVQATVSADRKYVTLNMRTQNSTLLALREFSFQNGPLLGNVGGVGNSTAGASGTVVGNGRNGHSGNGGADDSLPAVSTSPTEILARAKAQSSILFQTGMILVSRLSPPP